MHAFPHITQMHNALKISSFMLSLIINAVYNLHGCTCNLNVWYVARMSTFPPPFFFWLSLYLIQLPWIHKDTYYYNIQNFVHTQNINKIHMELNTYSTQIHVTHKHTQHIYSVIILHMHLLTYGNYIDKHITLTDDIHYTENTYSLHENHRCRMGTTHQWRISQISVVHLSLS